VCVVGRHVRSGDGFIPDRGLRFPGRTTLNLILLVFLIAVIFRVNGDGRVGPARHLQPDW